MSQAVPSQHWLRMLAVCFTAEALVTELEVVAGAPGAARWLDEWFPTNTALGDQDTFTP